MQVKDSFGRYIEEAIGRENAMIAFSAFEQPAKVAVRMNPFKKCGGPVGRPVMWSPYGYILDQRPRFTLDPSFHGGAYYVQDSSSMFVGHAFRQMLSHVEVPESGVIRVLDLCAAPGGKSTDLAASLREEYGDRFILVSNEVMKQRASVLADNMAIWGDPNVAVTSDDPSAFASLPGYFDIVVADVPCSGEGMFRKDEEAQRQWSEDNVALCEARQRRIIADMWPCLKQGGILIYSTCTFNRYENDGNAGWTAQELGADHLCLDEDFEGVIRTGYGYSLVPGHVEGEGQYCALLRKTSGNSGYAAARPGKARPVKGQDALPESLKSFFKNDVTLRQKGDLVTAVPSVIMQDVMTVGNSLHVLSAGCAVGVMKGRTLVPDADMALSLNYDQESFPCADVDRQVALAFLHKDSVTLEGYPKGYVLIRHEGLPLGFVKNLGNRCNNLHPQGRRIRMDIK